MENILLNNKIWNLLTFLYFKQIFFIRNINIKVSSRFRTDDLFYKNSNKDSSENYEETKVKFNPTKSFPPMK